MAILYLTGWESGDAVEASTAIVGTAAVQAVVKRTGGYALQCNPATTATGYQINRSASAWTAAASDALFAHDDLYISFYFRYATKPAANDEPFLEVRHAAGIKGELRINSSGNILFYNSAGTLIQTGATVLAADTWYLLDVRVGTSATVGPYEVKINGVSEFSGTGNLNAAQNATVRPGKGTNRNGNTVDYFYDDMIISDSAYVGAGAIEIMVPTASGTYSAWTGGTGTTFAEVDDVPHDSATTILTSTAQNDAHTLNLESTATAGISGTINGVKMLVVQRAASTTSSFQARIRNGSTDVDSGNLTNTTTYNARSSVIATDPNGGIAWTTSGLDSTEIGVEDVDAAVRIRCTHLSLHVHFTVAAGGFEAAFARGSNVVLGLTP